MIVSNAWVNRLCRCVMLPMHHLYPLVGSEALEGNTVPPIAEICWSRLTEEVKVDEGVSKIPPNARH